MLIRCLDCFSSYETWRCMCICFGLIRGYGNWVTELQVVDNPNPCRKSSSSDLTIGGVIGLLFSIWNEFETSDDIFFATRLAELVTPAHELQTQLCFLRFRVSSITSWTSL
ncbi:hypothetical protein KC19_VG168500 [Ceratodon purpureus]|uniref:Uncharacterized protein n=1 Tax=Ceratodon purpureus TaxID=3225 RepID=A0A8T0HRC9_CERPU|nr:hypothetical protein KC19_VG168500 [Ceratodon purpureus]